MKFDRRGHLTLTGIKAGLRVGVQLFCATPRVRGIFKTIQPPAHHQASTS